MDRQFQDNFGGTCDVSFEIEKAISESALAVNELSATRKGAFSWSLFDNITVIVARKRTIVSCP
jgi:hypothetical protein